MAQKKFKGKKKGDGRETLSLQDLAKAPHEDYKKEDREKGIPARIVSLSRTFAFARPDDGGEDIFIPGRALNNAFLGDAVLLDRVQQQEKGPSAAVKKVVEAGSRTLAGTIGRSELGGWEMRADAALRYALPLARDSLAGFHDGDKVQAEVVVNRYGAYTAQVTKIYGTGGSAKICADAIIDQNQIRTEFEAEVRQEARGLADAVVTAEEISGRLDLRAEPILTIDSASAKDLDDAISARKTERGFELGVHIADVSHYVKPDSALDQEAFLRGTSVYLPARVIPMLPKELSNGVCSLNAGTDKLTLSALITFDKTGNIRSYEFQKTVIRSKVRGVYSEVNSLFSRSADEAILKKYEPVMQSMQAAKELADVLKAKSKSDGTMELESTESEFVLDEDGVCIDVLPRHSGESEEMIEQLMIAANQAAAMLAKENGLPFVYRIHESPDPDRVDSLAQLVNALGLNAASLKHPGDVTTRDFANIMDQAENTPVQKIISHELLRTMAKARYDTAPVGHFGLALADYCHFTSPIRRYPDTMIHRIISTWLKTKDREKCLKLYKEASVKAAAHSSECEVRAMNAERSADDCYMAEYMRAHLGEAFMGVISGVTMRGVFVELSNSVEGFVPIDTFPDSDYQFDGVVTQYDRTTGKKLTIGQSLPVKVVASDVATGRIDFMYNGND